MTHIHHYRLETIKTTIGQLNIPQQLRGINQQGYDMIQHIILYHLVDESIFTSELALFFLPLIIMLAL